MVIVQVSFSFVVSTGFVVVGFAVAGLVVVTGLVVVGFAVVGLVVVTGLVVVVALGLVVLSLFVLNFLY